MTENITVDMTNLSKEEREQLLAIITKANLKWEIPKNLKPGDTFKDVDGDASYNFPYFVFEAYIRYGFTWLYIVNNVKFDFKHYYPKCRIKQVYLPDYLNK